MSAGKWAAAGVVVVAFIAAGAAHTTKPRSTAVRPVVAPGDVPAPLPGEWKLLWHDEFDGAALGPAWHAAQYWDEDHTVVGGGELQAYDATGVSVRDGMLHLTARAEAKYGVDYVSGLVQTGGRRDDPRRPKFSFTFGCLEVRAKLPAGKGIWPAVWMMPASYNDRNGELDVLEVIGSEPTVANFSLHREGRKKTRTWAGPDFSRDFHTFAVDWEPDRVRWYVDGVERAAMNDKALICPEAMYPILNLAVGGDWPGPPDATTKFPATMVVDYVRVWQRES
jgi:beta-glucanase (GH16 family)